MAEKLIFKFGKYNSINIDSISNLKLIGTQLVT